MNAYSITLHAHSGFRWLVLLLAVLIIIKSILGLINKGSYQKLDNILGASFTGLMHLQLLIGLVLYIFLSPTTQMAFDDFGYAMKNADLRFWAVEHITLMILAVVFAQVGRSKSKKASADTSKFKNQLIFFGISLVLMVVSIPWDRV